MTCGIPFEITCSEFITGKERLVKVLKQHRLQEVFDLLGMKHACVFSAWCDS